MATINFEVQNKEDITIHITPENGAEKYLIHKLIDHYLSRLDNTEKVLEIEPAIRINDIPE